MILPNISQISSDYQTKQGEVHKDLFDGKDGEKIQVYSTPLENAAAARAILANNPSQEQVLQCVALLEQMFKAAETRRVIQWQAGLKVGILPRWCPPKR